MTTTAKDYTDTHRIPLACHYCGDLTMLRKRRGYSQLSRAECVRCSIIADNTWVQDYLDAALTLAGDGPDVEQWAHKTIWDVYLDDVLHVESLARALDGTTSGTQAYLDQDTSPVLADDGAILFE